MDIPNHAELLTAVEAFCARHELAATRFGRDAIGNPNFIRGLREGISPTLETLTRVRDYMAGVDREAATRAKLAAEPEPAPAESEDIPLPFGTAPVNPTGASSPTCSPTNARPQRPAESASCPSCSADGPSLAAPATPTVAGLGA